MSRINSLKIKAKLLQKAKAKAGKPIQLKDAYEIIAKTAGYDSWRQMKKEIEAYAVFRPGNAGLPYWHNWYSTYEEAKSYLNRPTDFLIPFEGKYFLCGADYVEALGLSLDDSDLKLVGNDWASPKDDEAFERVLGKIRNQNASIND